MSKDMDEKLEINFKITIEFELQAKGIKDTVLEDHILQSCLADAKIILRQELADQKARAIEIVEDLASKADQNLESANRYQGMEAAATALREKL